MWKTDGWTPERAQQPHAADAQQHFLHDARGAVAAINAQRQIAEMLLVLRAVGIEQINRHAADVHAPGLKGTWFMPISTWQTSGSPLSSSTGSSGRFFGFSSV